MNPIIGKALRKIALFSYSAGVISLIVGIIMSVTVQPAFAYSTTGDTGSGGSVVIQNLTFHHTQTVSPPTSVPPTNTSVPPTKTPNHDNPTNTPHPTKVETTVCPPTATKVPPTATKVPPTNTSVPPTNTSVPPTNTSVPPTSTSVPPTSTPVPPTSTPVPPTNTSVPPTETKVVPTDTPTDEVPTLQVTQPPSPTPTATEEKPTPTDTNTPDPTQTSTNTPEDTATPTTTSTPVDTATATSTAEDTATPTSTATITLSPTPEIPDFLALKLALACVQGVQQWTVTNENGVDVVFTWDLSDASAGLISSAKVASPKESVSASLSNGTATVPANSQYTWYTAGGYHTMVIHWTDFGSVNHSLSLTSSQTSPCRVPEYTTTPTVQSGPTKTPQSGTITPTEKTTTKRQNTPTSFVATLTQDPGNVNATQQVLIPVTGADQSGNPFTGMPVSSIFLNLGLVLLGIALSSYGISIKFK
jgi:hypothetical protein